MTDMLTPTIRTEPHRRTMDMVLFGALVVLLAFGVLMVFTATEVQQELLFGDPGRVMRRQAVFGAIALLGFIVMSLIDYRYLRDFSPFLYIGIVVVLAVMATLTAVGAEPFFLPVRNGAQRWLEFGPIDVQPSELAKLIGVLAVAFLLSNHDEERLGWRPLIQALLIMGIPAALIFIQPDLSTMLVLGFTVIVMVFVSGMTGRQAAVLGIGSITALWITFRVGLLQEYQVGRLQSFLDPEAAPLDEGYNQLQSIRAIGSGRFFGKGIGDGVLTRLQFVPEQESDFIFTAVGEQLGFVGGVAVLIVYAVVVWRLLMIAGSASDRFGQLIAVGVAAILMFQVFVNIGMTIGIMPPTGLPLPFLSAGGTAALISAMGLGVANSVWLHRDQRRRR